MFSSSVSQELVAENKKRENREIKQTKRTDLELEEIVEPGLAIKSPKQKQPALIQVAAGRFLKYQCVVRALNRTVVVGVLQNPPV